MALSFDNTFNRVQDRLKISELETRFATLWDAAGGPELQREYRFAPPRRWRADFAWPQARLTINYLIAISLEQMFWAYSDFFCHSMTVFLYSKQSSFLLKS